MACACIRWPASRWKSWPTTPAVKADKLWRSTWQRMQAQAAFVPQLPSTLQAELRDYQVEGFELAARLAHWGVGACLADDMGLGKTLQALALILSRAPKGPTLVIAPTSVCMNWISEAARFAPT
jgi:SNF2 family DNA or RNA helicase